MIRKVTIGAIVSMLMLALSATAFGHVLDRGTAQKYAKQYAQTIVNDNEDGIYAFDLGRCRTISAHRQDCVLSFYYDDEHGEDGACDVTVSVRFYTRTSSRIRVVDLGDWQCDPES